MAEAPGPPTPLAARGKTGKRGGKKHREKHLGSQESCPEPGIPHPHPSNAHPIPKFHMNSKRIHRNPHQRPFPAASRSPERKQIHGNGKQIHGNGSGNGGAAGPGREEPPEDPGAAIPGWEHSRSPSPVIPEAPAPRRARNPQKNRGGGRERERREKLPKLSGGKTVEFSGWQGSLSLCLECGSRNFSRIPAEFPARALPLSMESSRLPPQLGKRSLEKPRRECRKIGSLGIWDWDLGGEQGWARGGGQRFMGSTAG